MDKVILVPDIYNATIARMEEESGVSRDQIFKAALNIGIEQLASKEPRERCYEVFRQEAEMKAELQYAPLELV